MISARFPEDLESGKPGPVSTLLDDGVGKRGDLQIQDPDISVGVGGVGHEDVGPGVFSEGNEVRLGTRFGGQGDREGFLVEAADQVVEALSLILEELFDLPEVLYGDPYYAIVINKARSFRWRCCSRGPQSAQDSGRHNPLRKDSLKQAPVIIPADLDNPTPSGTRTHPPEREERLELPAMAPPSVTFPRYRQVPRTSASTANPCADRHE